MLLSVEAVYVLTRNSESWPQKHVGNMVPKNEISSSVSDNASDSCIFELAILVLVEKIAETFECYQLVNGNLSNVNFKSSSKSRNTNSNSVRFEFVWVLYSCSKSSVQRTFR